MTALALLSRRHLPATVLWVVYAVGTAGFVWPFTRPLFQRLVVPNLLLSLGLLAWQHRGGGRVLVLPLAAVYALGLGAELLGVNHGLLFGQYAYGRALGWQVAHTPLMIGGIWLLLAYCFWVVTQPLPMLAALLLTAAGMTCMDLLIEPVAVRLHWWAWLSGDLLWLGTRLPLRNFTDWFLLSAVMWMLLHLTQRKQPPVQNPLAGHMLAVQACFFGVLTLGLPG